MLESFFISLISIVLEAMPFVLLGTLVSSLIEVFVSKEWIEQKLGSGKWYYYLIAGLMGIVFPVCECAIVPIMRRLIKKGVPTGIAITFMLAVPIVNPTVLFSTYFAFTGDWSIVVARALFGFIGAILIGLIMNMLCGKANILKKEKKHMHTCSCGHDHSDEHHESCECSHEHSHEKGNVKDTIIHIISHTAGEFLDVGRFLILGASIAAGMQTFIPRDMITIVSDNTILSILIMMLMAFVLSLCSEADAFIASTFRNSFGNSSLVAFLIFGPMIDIKNTIMLSASFKSKFVIRLIAVITIICFILAIISGFIL